MDLTNEELNECFTLLQGKCYHKWRLENMSDIVCEKCGEVTGTPYQLQNITPEGELSFSFRKYLEKEMPEVWRSFVLDMDDYYGPSSLTDALLNPHYFFVTLTAKKNRKKWGWVECSNWGPAELRLWGRMCKS
jgi:hypothetical protein